jgi:tRNA-binding protein
MATFRSWVIWRGDSGRELELVGRLVVVCVNLGTRDMGPYVSEALVLGAPHPESPEDQAQATPLYVSADVAPGEQVF